MRIAIIYDKPGELNKIDVSKLPPFIWNIKSKKYNDLKADHIAKFWQNRKDEIIQIFWMNMDCGYTLSFIWDKAYKEGMYDKVYLIDDERLKL